MKAPPLEHLLHLLGNGDPEAIEKVFVDVAPGLRSLVRRRMSKALRSKFDSEDVVLSVWTDLLSGFREGRWTFGTAGELRASRRRPSRPLRPCPKNTCREGGKSKSSEADGLAARDSSYLQP